MTWSRERVKLLKPGPLRRLGSSFRFTVTDGLVPVSGCSAAQSMSLVPPNEHGTLQAKARREALEASSLVMSLTLKPGLSPRIATFSRPATRPPPSAQASSPHSLILDFPCVSLAPTVRRSHPRPAALVSMFRGRTGNASRAHRESGVEAG